MLAVWKRAEAALLPDVCWLEGKADSLMWAWLKRLFVGATRCRLHVWTRNEYGVLVCRLCGYAAGDNGNEAII